MEEGSEYQQKPNNLTRESCASPHLMVGQSGDYLELYFRQFSDGVYSPLWCKEGLPLRFLPGQSCFWRSPLPAAPTEATPEVRSHLQQIYTFTQTLLTKHESSKSNDSWMQNY